nr:hypothetical protein [Tanacetum cinerariifolium]GEY75040.1 hypothetical protein [Tanacetum cinerariifolium]
MGGSHVTNVSPFDVDDFSTRKDRFLVYLDGLKPYLLEILENGPFMSKSPAFTSENVLIKPHMQWSLEDKRLANQGHEGPSKTGYTKIADLRLKFITFKDLEGKKDNDSDVEEDTRSNSVFLADLNAEFHDRALLTNQKSNYKRSKRISSTRKSMDKSRVAKSFDWDDESLSFKDEDYTNVDLYYVEEQRKNLHSKFNPLKQELSSCKSEPIDLKSTKVYNISLQNDITKLNLDNKSLRDEVSDLKRVIDK